ncbi:MAG: hypothetical protein KZQ75_06345 [Candidatus Thiodiazotropha sp. (ex Myrtea spinifera)]|nr:hypothetical protein [Candidatus Thiodiazotropha sp. (ex Myrtea spinifera)]MCU7829834.1 hypothetical protein [Candidatus Thiodiazotropha sp. (ex Myrtea sp. 'scaly one' KF741663)]MCU7851514.1 hypothetical protein [Candidatus Thiodiazotropha sp. (ex Monitilora ramsayi)]
MPKVDATNCTLCRVMRGLAFGGMGAAIGGYGSMLFGADKSDAVYYALFGAIALTAIVQRKRDKKDS